MNNASVQRRRTAASGRPLLTLPPAAKVLGLNGEMPSQGPEGPQTWAGRMSPSALRSPGRALRRPFYKAKHWLFLPRKFISRTGPLPEAVGTGVCGSELV